MITSIRAYKIRVKPLVLDMKRYEKVDITNQLELPLLDSAQRDGVLDTSRINLLNNSKKPLPRFMRIILELTDTVDNVSTVEKIYRVVDDDTVTNVVRGDDPLYRHVVLLIEPTKLLERRDVDNISFTNYLPHNYGIQEREVDYSRSEPIFGTANVGEPNGGPNTKGKEIYERGYMSDGRLYGPNLLVPSGGVSISANWKLDLKCRYSPGGNAAMMIATWFGAEYFVDMDLVEFYAIAPDGTRTNFSTNFSNPSTYTITDVGAYTFYQKYIDHYTAAYEDYEHLAQVTYSWRLIAIADERDAAREYTIEEVIDRLLRVHKVLAKSVDLPEFSLDDSLRERLSMIDAPEFSLTQCTLFEALCQIGAYFHAIPRLIPRITETRELDSQGELSTVVDDFSDWSIITFDFLDKTEEILGNVYSLIDIEANIDDYATDFISNVQNATVTNYDNAYSITEPYDDGFVSARTDDAGFEISDDHAVFKAQNRIRTILECVINVPTVDNIAIGEVDITDRILEKKAYDTKLEYNSSNTTDARAFYLYYEEGGDKICGLTYTRPASTVSSQLALSESIKEIIKLLTNKTYSGKIKDISYRIKYIPFNDFKIRQYRSYIDKSAEKSTLFYNQQANETDISHYGEAMHFALMRTGNPKQTPTQYFENLADVPKCGQWRKDGYVAFQVNREIYYKTPIKATTYWSKYYNELFADIAVKKAVRQFEISEKEAIKRNIDLQEFCVIDTTLDVAPLYKSGRTGDYITELRNYVEDRISKVSFGTNATMAAIAHRLLNTASAYNPISIAECMTESYNEGVKEKRYFIKPVNCFPSGRSAVFYFSFLDNYAAATKAVDRDGYYGIEHYVPYVDKYGRFKHISFVLAEKILEEKIADSVLVEINEKKLYEGEYTKQNVYADFSAGGDGYYVEKDNREQLSVTGQLNFVTPNQSIQIYKKFIEILPFIGESDETLKYVLFRDRQNEFDEYASGTIGAFDENGTMPLVQINALTKHIKINGVPNGGGGDWSGFGIITSKGKKCLYVELDLKTVTDIPPIYLMFRREI